LNKSVSFSEGRIPTYGTVSEGKTIKCAVTFCACATSKKQNKKKTLVLRMVHRIIKG